MANSATQYIGNGTTTAFSIGLTLSYLRESHIKVFLDEVETTAFSLINADQNGKFQSVQLNTAPAQDVVVLVRRITQTTLIHDYQDGALILEEHLDESNLQALMLAEEAQDGFFDEGRASDLNMGGNRVINTIAGVLPTDGVTLEQAQAIAAQAAGSGVIPQVQPRQQGDGVTTTFNTPASTQQVPQSFFINLDGISQRPNTDYIANADGTVTFKDGLGNDEAIASGVDIDITLFEPLNNGSVAASVVTADDSTESRTLGAWMKKLWEFGKNLVTATGSTTARSLEDRFADVVNVKDFGAVGDGVADDTQALLNAAAVGSSVYLPRGVYNTTQMIYLHNQDIVGDGSELSVIQFTGTTKATAILQLSSRASVYRLQVRYLENVLDGTEARSERVGIYCGGQFGLQHAKLQDLIIRYVGTGIANLSDDELTIPGILERPAFSNTFDTIEIRDFTRYGVDFTTKNRTGNIYQNIFIETSDANKFTAPYNQQEVGFSLSGSETECVIDQLNVERVLANNSITLDNIQAPTIGSIHIEDVRQRGNYTGVLFLQNSPCMISALSVINCPDITVNGFAIIDCGAFVYKDAVSGTEFFQMDLSKIRINTLHVRGLGTNNGGLGNLTDFLIIRGVPTGTSTSAVRVSVGSYVYHSYVGTDLALYRAFPVQTGNIRLYVDADFRRAMGKVEMGGGTSQTVTLPFPVHNTQYTVQLTPIGGAAADGLRCANLTTTSFDVVTDSNFFNDVHYVATPYSN